MNINLPLAVLFFLLFAESASAQITVAVLDLDAEGVTKPEANLITDRLRTQLFTTSRFVVIEREKMANILKEQDFQLSDCASNECAVQIGQLLGAKQIVVGKVGKIGTLYTLNVRLVDVQSGVVLKTATEDCSCPIETFLKKSVHDAANTLAEQNAGDFARKRSEQMRSALKSPIRAGLTALPIPIVGHAYVGTTGNIIRGSAYTITSGLCFLMYADVISPIGGNPNDYSYFLVAGILIDVVAAIDAGLSAKKYNRDMDSKSFSLMLGPNQRGAISVQLTLRH